LLAVANFREFFFRDCPKRCSGDAPSVNLAAKQSTKSAKKELLGIP
jgi:hypothetical protein